MCLCIDGAGSGCVCALMGQAVGVLVCQWARLRMCLCDDIYIFNSQT